MCLQCSTHAQLIQADVLPGVQLYQATKTDGDWKQGWYGLVVTNDPFMLIPPEAIAVDPLFGLSDFAIAAVTGTEQAESAFWAAAAVMNSVRIAPENCWTLCEACRKAGYNPEADGSLPMWLSHRLAKVINQAI